MEFFFFFFWGGSWNWYKFLFILGMSTCSLKPLPGSPDLSFHLPEPIVQYFLIVKDVIETVSRFKHFFQDIHTYIVFLFTFHSFSWHMQNNCLISSFGPSLNTYLLPGTLLFRMKTEIKDRFPTFKFVGRLEK